MSDEPTGKPGQLGQAMTPRVDLDELEAVLRKERSWTWQASTWETHMRLVVPALIAELRAARKVVEAVAAVDPISEGRCIYCQRWTTTGMHDDDCAWLAARGMVANR